VGLFSAGTEEWAVNASCTLAEFAARQSVPLTRFGYLLCGDHQRAEDLVQEAFLAAYRRFGDVLPVAAPEAYLRKTIVNAHISSSRRRAASELPVDELPDSPEPPVDRSERDLLWRALAALPARQRAVLVLRYYLDLPDQEIADLLACRRGTVRSLAARAFATLRIHPALVEETS
jgi:RNA polymerase sigma-70 factor (sigma-E family)